MKKIFWSDIRDKVRTFDPALSNEIDNLSPGKEFHLYKLKYRYGEHLLHKGEFRFPMGSTLSATLKSEFSYAGTRTPTGFVLNKTVELYIDTPMNLLPWRLYKPGDFFAAFFSLESSSLYHPASVFSMTSGARNVFFIPNITHRDIHQRMCRRLNIKTDVPLTLLEQWNNFKDILQDRSDWTSEVILFPKKWINAIKNDKAWSSLRSHIEKKEWLKTNYLRNKVFYDLAMSQVHHNRNLRPNTHMRDTAKHILAIASGGVLGFKPAIDDETLPNTKLREIYSNNYNFKGYAPVLVEPTFFDINTIHCASSVYYSLQHPTNLEFSPSTRKDASTISELIELKRIVEIFYQEVLAGKIPLSGNLIVKVCQDISIDYYHTKPDPYGEIAHSKILPTLDDNLRKCLTQNGKHLELSASGMFLRGLVRISPKDKE